MYYSLQKKI